MLFDEFLFVLNKLIQVVRMWVLRGGSCGHLLLNVNGFTGNRKLTKFWGVVV